MTTATKTKRHDGSNRKACSMCGQRRGSWTERLLRRRNADTGQRDSSVRKLRDGQPR